MKYSRKLYDEKKCALRKIIFVPKKFSTVWRFVVYLIQLQGIGVSEGNKVRKDLERSKKSKPVEFCLLTGKLGGKKNQTSSHPHFGIHWIFNLTNVNKNPFSRNYISHELKKDVFFCVGMLCIFLATHFPREKRALSQDNPSTQTEEASNGPHSPISRQITVVQQMEYSDQKWVMYSPKGTELGESSTPPETKKLGFIEQFAHKVCFWTTGKQATGYTISYQNYSI